MNRYARHDGICIGGPLHGQAVIMPTARFAQAVLVSSLPKPGGPNRPVEISFVNYSHLRNEFGEWWIVD